MNIPEIGPAFLLLFFANEYLGLTIFSNAVFFERYVIDLLNIDSKIVHSSLETFEIF